MAERFTDHLRTLAEPIWRAQHEHPFVRGISDGTLDIERFKHWVRQDYLYLIDYCRLLGLASARAPDLDTLTRFAAMLQATAHTEMDLHRAYAREFGIEPSELEQELMAPTTRAYTDFLLRVAAIGDYAELVAALLPCLWGFSDIGRALDAAGAPDEPRYAKWIAMYADSDFAVLAEWCRDLLDRLANGCDENGRHRIEDAFLTSSRYELAFWQMAWTGERWQV
jgi:thiaminase (transcriptional activator TenA)